MWKTTTHTDMYFLTTRQLTKLVADTIQAADLDYQRGTAPDGQEYAAVIAEIGRFRKRIKQAYPAAVARKLLSAIPR